MKTLLQLSKNTSSHTPDEPSSASREYTNPVAQFVDQRPEATRQAKLQQKADASPAAARLKALQRKAATSSRLQAPAQLQRKANQSTSAPAQPKSNKTGLPDALKSGVEQLSGHSMDDVRVHYNSVQPAQLHAHAYAQGNQIHLAPGQEKHLPHEAWHVAQQKQGRVQPTVQMKGVQVNNDRGLEREADVMGAKAMQMKAIPNLGHKGNQRSSTIGNKATAVIQGEFWVENKKNYEWHPEEIQSWKWQEVGTHKGGMLQRTYPLCKLTAFGMISEKIEGWKDEDLEKLSEGYDSKMNSALWIGVANAMKGVKEDKVVKVKKIIALYSSWTKIPPLVNLAKEYAKDQDADLDRWLELAPKLKSKPYATAPLGSLTDWNLTELETLAKKYNGQNKNTDIALWIITAKELGGNPDHVEMIVLQSGAWGTEAFITWLQAFKTSGSKNLSNWIVLAPYLYENITFLTAFANDLEGWTDKDQLQSLATKFNDEKDKIEQWVAVANKLPNDAVNVKKFVIDSNWSDKEELAKLAEEFKKNEKTNISRWLKVAQVLENDSKNSIIFAKHLAWDNIDNCGKLAEEFKKNEKSNIQRWLDIAKKLDDPDEVAAFAIALQWSDEAEVVGLVDEFIKGGKKTPISTWVAVANELEGDLGAVRDFVEIAWTNTTELADLAGMYSTNDKKPDIKYWLAAAQKLDGEPDAVVDFAKLSWTDETKLAMLAGKFSQCDKKPDIKYWIALAGVLIDEPNAVEHFVKGLKWNDVEKYQTLARDYKGTEDATNIDAWIAIANHLDDPNKVAKFAQKLNWSDLTELVTLIKDFVSQGKKNIDAWIEVAKELTDAAAAVNAIITGLNWDKTNLGALANEFNKAKRNAVDHWIAAAQKFGENHLNDIKEFASITQLKPIALKQLIAMYETDDGGKDAQKWAEEAKKHQDEKNPRQLATKIAGFAGVVNLLGHDLLSLNSPEIDKEKGKKKKDNRRGQSSQIGNTITMDKYELHLSRIYKNRMEAMKKMSGVVAKAGDHYNTSKKNFLLKISCSYKDRRDKEKKLKIIFQFHKDHTAYAISIYDEAKDIHNNSAKRKLYADNFVAGVNQYDLSYIKSTKAYNELERKHPTKSEDQVEQLAAAQMGFSKKHDTADGSIKQEIEDDEKTGKFTFDAYSKIVGEGARWKCVRSHADHLKNSSKFWTYQDPTVTGPNAPVYYIEFKNLWVNWSHIFSKEYDIPDNTVADELRNRSDFNENGGGSNGRQSSTKNKMKAGVDYEVK